MRATSRASTARFAAPNGTCVPAPTGCSSKSPRSVEELAEIGGKFDVPQMANMLEGGRTPILPPSELGQLGFRIALYGISLLMHAVARMQEVLASLAAGRVDFVGSGIGFEDYKSLVDFDMWAGIEDRYHG